MEFKIVASVDRWVTVVLVHSSFNSKQVKVFVVLVGVASSAEF